MSKRVEESWSLWCDWPGCKTQFEYGDYSIFGDGWDAEDMLTDSDWRIGRDGQAHYCAKHPCVWASDHEDGEPFPEPPYLLIHDGDTAEPIEDDGKVTLVEAAAA